jgi:anhydro-N-acetylmuramic acid kinase
MTCQIGNGAHIAAITGQSVIDNVRYADIAAGGVGAPFAPLADKYLLKGYDFYLNLGGITNLTHILAGEPIAWDLGGCNQLLNHLSKKLNISYDKDGEIARKGTTNKQLLHDLHQLFPIYVDEPIAMDNQQVVNLYFPLLDSSTFPIEDIFNTTTVYIVSQIQKTLEQIFQKYTNKRHYKLIATGGGALNTYMMELLQQKAENLNIELIIPTKQIIEFKEAALLALIGLFRLHQIPNSLSSVTGAKYPPIGGALHTIRK